MTRRLVLIGLAFAAIVFLAPTVASAQSSNTSTLLVQANVTTSCMVAPVGALNFNNYDGSLNTNTVDITVTCNIATDHWLGLGPGYDFFGGFRHMRDVTLAGHLAYELFHDGGFADPWTNADNAAYHQAVTPATHTVHGRIPADQILAIQGPYTDSVVVTVNF